MGSSKYCILPNRRPLQIARRLSYTKQGEEESLTAGRLICAVHPPAAALAHVAQKVDGFLLQTDTCQWTLKSASERGFVRFLDRLLKWEHPGLSSVRDGRLKQGIRLAVINGHDVRVLEWWLRRYMPDQTLYTLEFVLALAVEYAQLPVLEWIHRETQDRLPPSLKRALSCYNPQVIYWLYEHDGRQLLLKLR